METNAGKKGSKAVPSLLANSAYNNKLGGLYFRKVPHTVYFYYVTLSNLETTRHYFYSSGDRKIYKSEIPEIVRALGRNVTKKYEAPPFHREGFANDCKTMTWRRKSYFVLLLDKPYAAAHFADKNGVAFNSDYTNKDNYSFFDAENLEIDLSDNEDGSDIRSAFVCINHMKGHGTTIDVGQAEQCYKFSLNLEGTDTKLRGYRAPDSGGTNMGPPVPPPVPI